MGWTVEVHHILFINDRILKRKKITDLEHSLKKQRCFSCSFASI